MVKHLERHPRAVDLACWDCKTPLVPIGVGEHVADDGQYHEIWHWFQCPYCGLYVQTDVAGIGLSSTLDPGEVNTHPRHKSANDPLQPDQGYIATWPGEGLCRACRGRYPAQARRRWRKEGRKLVASTTLTRLPASQSHMGSTYRLNGQTIPPCRCPSIDEQQGTLERILSGLPTGYFLRIPDHHPDARLGAGAFLIGQTGAWPRLHTTAEVLAILQSRGSGTDPNHPLQCRVLYAYSPSARRGAIWPLYGSAPSDWFWAEVLADGQGAGEKAGLV